MKNKSVAFITQTAMLIALAVAVQTVFRSIPNLVPINQFIIGSLVNFFLIIATLLIGYWSGFSVALLTPFIALLQGQIGYPQQVIIIALGNVAIITVYWLVFKLLKKANIFVEFGIAAVLGSLLKFIVLWYGMTAIFIPLVLQNDATLKAPQIEKMTSTIMLNFSWPQIVTALIGSVLAIAVIPVIKKVLKKDR